jgi:beta-xylosidase
MRMAMNQWIAIPMLMTLLNTQLSFGQSYSRAWVPDNGNGTYKNPVLNADYSDPDAIRVGDDFYLVSSSFNHVPGLPILHSRDLVNWRLIGHALTVQPPEAHFSTVRHGGGVWAPSIRFHQGEFYIFYPDPDFGIYMIKARRPEGPWSAPHLVQAGKGLIDPCPFWDADGRAWLAYAYAGSRAGIKSIIVVRPMTPDAKQFIGPPVMVYDGHTADPTIEGPKLYKRNGWYYIFAPGGGVSTGWQTILRSRNILGPYERKVALAQGQTNVNGPHQGAWVDTKSGEDWFLHFQDKGAYGRVVHLQPMRWKNDWPVIGEDADGDGTGSPVTMHRKPRVAVPVSIITPADSDEFDKPAIGLQWQWQANPQEGWAFPTPEGKLRLFSVYQPDSIRSLWNTPNILGQKTPADSFSAQVNFRFTPRHVGERFGLVLFGSAYADVSIVNKAEGLVVECRENAKAEKGGIDKTLAATPVKGADFTLYLRMMPGGKYMLGYAAADGRATWFEQIFSAQPGKWVGAKVGMYMLRNNITNDAGYVDVDYFRISK